MTLSFIIPPLLDTKAVLGVHGMVLCCCVVVLWKPGVIWYPMNVSIGGGGGGGGGGELISNLSDIF